MTGSMAFFRQWLREIDRRNAVTSDYQKTLALLVALQAGEIALDGFEMTADGWNLIDPPAAVPAPGDPPAEAPNG